MILPDFVIPSRAGQVWEYSGVDSYEHCLDKKHFKSYPHNVSYQYNSRGFRDTEWSNDLNELAHAIWCVGDSFTEGLGSPVQHTWPFVLQKVTGTKTINVSMDGASNSWISRKVIRLLETLEPRLIVVQWSYTTRRETDLETARKMLFKQFYDRVKDSSWPDCVDNDTIDSMPDHIQHELLGYFHYKDKADDVDRQQVCDYTATHDDDTAHTLDCLQQVCLANKGTKIVHSFIPDFSYQKDKIQQWMFKKDLHFVPEFARLDLARDGHHYDIKTCQHLVQKIVSLLN